MSDVSINNNSTAQTAAKVAGAGAITGAVIQGGNALYCQHKILSKPDEFITTLKGEVEAKKGFNTKFFKGTQEAADLANKQLDEYLQKGIDFAKGGKYDFGAIAKKAGVGAVIAGISWAAIYGIYKVAQHALKGGAKVVAEGVNEAKTNKA